MFISCIKAIQHTKNIYEDSVIVDMYPDLMQAMKNTVKP